MNQFTIPLRGLGCGKCIKKVTEQFSDTTENTIMSLSKHSLVLETTLSLNDVIQQIESLNYQAGNQVTLALSGLKCGKCVNKLSLRLAEHQQIATFNVTKTELTLVTTLSEADIIDIVFDTGFSAESKQDNIAEAESVTQSTEQVEQTEQVTLQQAVQQQSKSKISLILQGMTCASCVSSVEKACLRVEEVTHAQINLAEQTASISLLSDTAEVRDKLINSISSAGYQASIIEDESQQQSQLQTANIKAQQQFKRSAISALSIGAPLMLWGVMGGNMMIRSSTDQFTWGIIGAICLLLLLTAGRSFFINAWQSLVHRRATMDTLVALGTGSAWLYSMLVVIQPSWFPSASRHVYFEASAMIIGLISLGHYIEAKAKYRTTQSLQALVGLQAKFATVKLETGDQKLPIADIQLGMQIRIKPGEKVPVDGIVIQGESYIDEAMLTGEPIAKYKQIGDKVSAGTLNNDGSLVIEATGVGSKTMLARIIKMVREAQSSKPPIAKLADSISAVFVPIVVAIAAISAVVWWQFGPEPQASYMLVVSTTVLIIACPCALGLATPLSITVGVGKAAELGILIKDAQVLQSASQIDTVVFDKTGTLTVGKPTVQDVTLLNNASLNQFLTMVYALETHSQHPLAAAICDYAKQHNTSLVEASEIISLGGKGINGTVNNEQVIIGSVNYLQAQSIVLDKQAINSYIDKAWTPVVVSINGIAAGIIAISDPLKEDAKQAVSQLKKNGLDVVLLSGDNQTVAEHIATELGITTTIAEVLPDEKALHITKLQESGRKVAMVGDGINDAPALAQADIGIAMGSGSDVAIESAQMTLLNSSPLAINNAIELSKATLKNMKQNLFGAFVYNIIGIPIAAGVLYPTFGFLLSPVFAGAAMALSSITVVSNANRLRLFKVNQP